MPAPIKQLQDKEWLMEQYVEHVRSTQDIADEVGCSKSAVARSLKRHGIEARSRTSKFAKLNDEEWLRQKYEVEQLSLNEIADLVGSSAGNVWTHLQAKGIETRSEQEALEVKYPDGRYGELAANWKGGRKVANNRGYVHIYQPDHPHATQSGYVMEHRLVMEEELGRYLEPDEDVHHINEDPTDNRPENLMVLSRSDHRKIHGLLTQKKMLDAEIKRLQKRIAELEAELEQCKGSR